MPLVELEAGPIRRIHVAPPRVHAAKGPPIIVTDESGKWLVECFELDVKGPVTMVYDPLRDGVRVWVQTRAAIAAQTTPRLSTATRG